MFEQSERAANEQRLYAWFPRENEQALVVEAGIDGRMADDNVMTTEVGVFLNDSSYTKLEYWLSTSVDVSCDVASRAVTTAVTMTNSIPSGDFASSTLGARNGRVGLPRTTMMLEWCTSHPRALALTARTLIVATSTIGCVPATKAAAVSRASRSSYRWDRQEASRSRAACHPVIWVHSRCGILRRSLQLMSRSRRPAANSRRTSKSASPAVMLSPSNDGCGRRRASLRSTSGRASAARLHIRAGAACAQCGRVPQIVRRHGRHARIGRLSRPGSVNEHSRTSRVGMGAREPGAEHVPVAALPLAQPCERADEERWNRDLMNELRTSLSGARKHLAR
jgi:hypothetical protein